MRRNLWPLCALVLVLVLYGVRYLLAGAQDSIEYQGQRFKTAKRYWSYEDYKDDPNNLDPRELPRIEKVMRDASIPRRFDSRDQFNRAVFGLKFPGYGLSSSGEQAQSDGSVLLLTSVEIPHRSLDRYFVGRRTGKQWDLVDDFVAESETNIIRQVNLLGMKLQYYNDKHALILEHQLAN